MTERLASSGESRPGRFIRSADGGAAILLLLLALLVTLAAIELPFGRMRRPGPGILPSVLAGVLALAALRLVVKALVATAPELIEKPNAFGFVLLLPAFLAFALMADMAGLALSSLALLLVAGTAVPGTYASPMRARRYVLYAVLMSAGCVILFAELLGLPISILPEGW